MLLLRPKTTISDTITDNVLMRALKKGRLYATITNKDENVELFTSLMFLWSSLLNQKAAQPNPIVL